MKDDVSAFEENPIDRSRNSRRWGRRLFAIFFTVLGALGAYVTIQESQRLGIVATALGLAIGLTAFGMGWPYLRQAWLRVGRYPQLLVFTQGLERDRKQLEDRNQHLLTSSNYSEGVEEGKKQALASVFSAIGATPPPRLVEILLDAGGLKLVAVQTGHDPPLRRGLRFTIETEHAEEVKGVVEVLQVDQDTRKVRLACVDERVPEFWRFLKENAPRQPSPPEGIRLGKYLAAPPTEWPTWPDEFAEALNNITPPNIQGGRKK